MPTGYTDRLEKRDFDLLKWLKEDAVRAMGVCVILRDEGNLSEAEILERLRKDASENYHEEKLRVARAELAAAKERTDQQWTVAYSEAKHKAQQDYEKRKKEHDEKSAKHLRATKRVEAMLAKAPDKEGVVRGTLRFALEQLQRAWSFDYGHDPYQEEVLRQTEREWISATNNKTLWNIEYHSKELAKMDQRAYDRFSGYKELVEFVDNVGAQVVATLPQIKETEK